MAISETRIWPELVCNQELEPVCDLDSVMEFNLKQVADQLANQLAITLSS